MYDLYQNPMSTQQGLSVKPHWWRLQKQLLATIEKISFHAQSNPLYLKSDHLLVRLIDSFTVSRTLPLRMFVDKIGDQTYPIASALGLTSMLQHGRMQTGVFYGKQIQEAIVVITSEFDLNQMESNWRTMRPITVAYHSHYGLDFSIPDGRLQSPEPGNAVVVINAPMLMAQYRMWFLEQRAVSISVPNTGVFIQQHVLPQMLYSHADQVMVNRLMRRYYRLPMANFRNPHSHYTINYSHEVDSVLDSVIQDWLKHPSYRVETVIRQWPQVSTNDLSKHLKVPEGTYMRNQQWPFVIANTAITIFLLDLIQKTNNQANSEFITQLRLFIRRLKSDNYMRSYLPSPVYQTWDKAFTIGIVDKVT